MKINLSKKTIIISSISSALVIAIILATIFIPKLINPNSTSDNSPSSSQTSGSSKPTGNSNNSSDGGDSLINDTPDIPTAKINYPAPEMSENPQLLKEFAIPSATIATSKFSDKFSVSFTGAAGKDAPEIAGITDQAAPNDSVSIYGVGFSGAKVYAYGLVNDEGVIKQLEVTTQRDDFVNAIIDPSFQYGLYIIWIEGKNGKLSTPVRVNAPTITWLSSTKASSKAEIRVYGKFLTTNNADGEGAKSNVYITSGDLAYKANVIEASPYRLTIKLPEGLKNNTEYKVWVHNGHGGEYGWSNSLPILHSEDAENFYKGKKHTVKVSDGKATDSDISTAINNAAAGDTVYLPAGVYEINDQIKIRKSIKLEGEAKDKVIFVCVFGKTRSGNNSLAYGDLHTNSASTAAFEVAATPCEFTNISFIDYVEGGEYSEGIKKPTNYHIDYAYGMFIKANDTSDNGAAGNFRVDNCNFKVQRLYSDATNCIYLKANEQENYHKEFEKKYNNYSRVEKGSAPLWIETDRSEIINCHFEIAKGIMTRHMNNSSIRNNTFEGIWIMAGNSGPCAIADNNSQNLDISNNRIYGKDEVTDPNGHVVTGDQTFARTIVFQMPYGVSKNLYIMNNNASRVGELNYNSGEHILFEEVGITYTGKGTLSNGNTLKLKDMPTEKWKGNGDFTGYFTNDDGSIKLGHTRNVVGQVVTITKGKGQGQWRSIEKAGKDCTVTLDRPFDVQPDETSVFVVSPAFVGSVVYGNKIEGPELYYKNYNSTNGVNAYGTMVDTVIDRNDFSQMQVGIALNPQYNMKNYTYNGNTVRVDYNFIMYCDMLVTGNTIKNTRYGIWNFPSLTLDGIDNSDSEADINLQLCLVIRGNNISDQRYLTGGADTNDRTKSEPDFLKRGGVSIVIGRDYWNSTHVLSTRYWMNDAVVENNKLNNPMNNYLDISFSQNGTIIRNNSYDGKTGLPFDEVNIKHNGHKTQKTSQAPAYFK